MFFIYFIVNNIYSYIMSFFKFIRRFDYQEIELSIFSLNETFKLNLLACSFLN